MENFLNTVGYKNLILSIRNLLTDAVFNESINFEKEKQKVNLKNHIICTVRKHARYRKN